MKKITLVLVVLLAAAPALAEVTITATVVQNPENSADTDTVIIGWECSDANLVRAFALDIILDKPVGDPTSDPVIQAVIPLDANYWVYPGSIVILDGDVSDYGSPISDPCQYPGTLPGPPDSNGVTIEMGSLYAANDPCHTSPPATSGDLLAIVVNDNCVLSVKENTVRGGVVMEDGSSGTNFPSNVPVNLYTAADIAEWRKVGKPKCWARGMNARQCRGDCDGVGIGIMGNIFVNYLDNEIRKAARNLSEAALKAASGGKGWKTATVYDVDPGCSAAVKDVLLICADLDHTGIGIMGDIRVSFQDNAIRKTFRNIAGKPDPNCP